MTTTSATTTGVVDRQAFRRLVLRIDSAVSAANGAAYLALAGPLGDLFGVSAGLLRGLGAFLLVWAAGLWLVSNRPQISRPAMIDIAALNGVWVIGSIVLAATGVSSPDTAGTVWTLLQAAAVSGFVGLQLVAARTTD